MAPEKGTVVLLEAVETTTDQTTPPDRPGALKWGGPYGVIQPERLLANERQCSGATRLGKDWLLIQGVPYMRSRWIAIHYGKDAMSSPVV